MTDKTLNLNCLKQAMKLLPEPIRIFQKAYMELPDRLSPVPIIDNSSINAKGDDTFDKTILVFIAKAYCEGTECQLEWELVL